SAHVTLPSIRTGFATASRILFATERAPDLGPGGADVDICDAAVGADGRQKGLSLAQVLSEYGGGQALGNIVLLGDRRRETLVAQTIEDRSERLAFYQVGLAAEFDKRG